MDLLRNKLFFTFSLNVLQLWQIIFIQQYLLLSLADDAAVKCKIKPELAQHG